MNLEETKDQGLQPEWGILGEQAYYDFSSQTSHR